MAVTLTPHLNLSKPAFDDPADERLLNTNFDLIDAAVAATDAQVDANDPLTTPGDLIVGGVAGAAGRLAVGAASQVLTVVAGAPIWAPPTPMTSPGDLIIGGVAGAAQRLPIGATTQALTVVGGVPTWTAPTYGGMTNPMTAVGDVIVGAASGGAVRLGVGTTDQVLTVAAGTPAWVTPTAQQTLLTNGGFEVDQRGGTVTGNLAYAHDRWQNLLGGTSTVTITDETVLCDTGSGHALKAVYVHGTLVSQIDQKIEAFAQLRGRTVTFAIRVRKGVANSVRPYVNDSGTRTYGATSATTGAYTTMTVTATIGAAATSVTVGVEASISDTYYLDSAVLVVGSTAPAYAPLIPADEWARCLRYYETIGGVATIERVALLQAYATTRANGVLAFKVTKAVAPIVTANSAGNFALQTPNGSFSGLTGLVFAYVTPRSCDVDAVTGPTVFTLGDATLLFAVSSLNGVIAIEANPP